MAHLMNLRQNKNYHSLQIIWENIWVNFRSGTINTSNICDLYDMIGIESHIKYQRCATSYYLIIVSKWWERLRKSFCLVCMTLNLTFLDLTLIWYRCLCVWVHCVDTFSGTRRFAEGYSIYLTVQSFQHHFSFKSKHSFYYIWPVWFFP